MIEEGGEEGLLFRKTKLIIKNRKVVIVYPK